MCSHCHGRLEVTFPSWCVTTIPTLVCKGKCGISRLPPVFPRFKRTANTDFALNLHYVLGFMCSGDGGTESQRLLGFLDLPHSATMERKTYSLMECTIGPYILTICNDAMDAMLIREVELSSHDDPDFNFEEWFDNKAKEGHFVLRKMEGRKANHRSYSPPV